MNLTMLMKIRVSTHEYYFVKEKRCLETRTDLSYRFGDWLYEECKRNKSKNAIIAENFRS